MLADRFRETRRLTEAEAAGKGHRNGARLRKDDFAAFHDRDDFKQLLADPAEAPPADKKP